MLVLDFGGGAMAKKRDLDDVGGVELMSEMFRLFGATRAAELIGWAVLWGVTGVKDAKQVRQDLEARGLSESTAYRAAADFRKLRDELEKKEQRTLTFADVIGRFKVL